MCCFRCCMDFFNTINRTFNVVLCIVGLLILSAGLFLAEVMSWTFNAYSVSVVFAGALLALLSLIFATIGHQSPTFVLVYMLCMLFLVVVDATGAGAVLYSEQEIRQTLNQDFNQTDVDFRLTSQNMRVIGWGILVLVGVQVLAVLLAWSQRQQLMEIFSEQTIFDLRQQLLEAPDPEAVRALEVHTRHVSAQNENLRLRLQSRIKSEQHDNLIIDTVVHSIIVGCQLTDFVDTSNQNIFLGVFITEKFNNCCEELKDVILYSRLTHVGGLGDIGMEQKLEELTAHIGQYKNRPLRLRFEYTRDSEIVEASFRNMAGGDGDGGGGGGGKDDVNVSEQTSLLRIREVASSVTAVASEVTSGLKGGGRIPASSEYGEEKAQITPVDDNDAEEEEDDDESVRLSRPPSMKMKE